MNQNQLKAIEETIEIIERTIKQNLDLEQLSKQVGLSKYHLHHLFKSITDRSMMAYVRNRKLSRSLNELLHSNLNIIDIANEYHFEHEQSYIRAFKQEFHVTPAEYRRAQCQLPIEQKIDFKGLSSIGQGLMVQPKMVMHPAIYLQGIEREIVHTENLQNKTTNQQAEEFWNIYVPMIQNQKKQQVFYGLVRYREHSEYSNDYATCVETCQPNPEEPPFVQYTLPAQEYAVFRYVGLHNVYQTTYETLLDIYDCIDNHWAVNTGFHQNQPYHFERMDLGVCSDDYCEMDIYIPISVN